MIHLVKVLAPIPEIEDSQHLARSTGRLESLELQLSLPLSGGWADHSPGDPRLTVLGDHLREIFDWRDKHGFQSLRKLSLSPCLVAKAEDTLHSLTAELSLNDCPCIKWEAICLAQAARANTSPAVEQQVANGAISAIM